MLALEPSRRFAAAEMRAGRIPLWTPYGFAGAPFADFAKYSPFNLVYTLLPSPFTLAWIQLLKSLVAGMGAYLFFRRALRVSFWPAAFGAWCYPLSGFFVLWQGYPSTFVTAWFPWLLVAVDLIYEPSMTMVIRDCENHIKMFEELENMFPDKPKT